MPLIFSVLSVTDFIATNFICNEKNNTDRYLCVCICMCECVRVCESVSVIHCLLYQYITICGRSWWKENKRYRRISTLPVTFVFISENILESVQWQPWKMSYAFFSTGRSLWVVKWIFYYTKAQKIHSYLFWLWNISLWSMD